MWYSMLLVADGQNNPTSFLTIDTDHGRMIVLFEDEQKLETIGRHAARQILEQGQTIVEERIKLSSKKDIKKAQREVRKSDPSLSNAFIIMDSHPFVAELVTSIRQGRI